MSKLPSDIQKMEEVLLLDSGPSIENNQLKHVKTQMHNSSNNVKELSIVLIKLSEGFIMNCFWKRFRPGKGIWGPKGSLLFSLITFPN